MELKQPNYEVVVFRLWTLTTPHLGSCCLKLYFNLALLPHLFFLLFLNPLFPLFFLPPPHPYHFLVESFSLHRISASFTGAKRCPPEHFPHPPPASLLWSSLCPALCSCICRRFCAIALQPLPTLSCNQVPVRPWRVACSGSLFVYVSMPCPYEGILLILVLSGP